MSEDEHAKERITASVQIEISPYWSAYLQSNSSMLNPHLQLRESTGGRQNSTTVSCHLLLKVQYLILQPMIFMIL